MNPWDIASYVVDPGSALRALYIVFRVHGRERALQAFARLESISVPVRQLRQDLPDVFRGLYQDREKIAAELAVYNVRTEFIAITDDAGNRLATRLIAVDQVMRKVGLAAGVVGLGILGWLLSREKPRR